MSDITSGGEIRILEKQAHTYTYMYGLLITQSRWSGSSTLGSMESLQTSHDFWKTCIMQSIGRTKEERVELNNNENQFTIISCKAQKTIQTKTFPIRL